VVHNIQVSRWHTFFVGGGGWGFSVWVHNHEICDLLKKFRQAQSSGNASEAAKAADEIRAKLSKFTPEDLAKARLNDPKVKEALDGILDEKIFDSTPVAPGDKGTYGELKAKKKAQGETEPLDMDHQPSLAAQIAAKETALGRKLTPAERAAVKQSTPAVASPRPVHQQTSPTFGGRNSSERIKEDAKDLKGAAERDRAAFDKGMRER
jgi:hypothetical protein